MIQARHALHAEVGAGGRLRLDDGGEFVGAVVQPGAVGQVDEGAGREAVTAGGGTPEQRDGTPLRLIRPEQRKPAGETANTSGCEFKRRLLRRSERRILL